MLDIGLALLSHDVGCRNLSTCQSEFRNVSSVQQDNIYMVIHVVFLSWVCFQMVYDFVGHEFWFSLTYWVAGWTINHIRSQQGKGHLLIRCVYTVPYIVELWILNRGHRCYHKTTSNSTKIFRYTDCHKNQAEWLNSPLFFQLSLNAGTPEKKVLSKTKTPLASCPKLTPCIPWSTASLKSCPGIWTIFLMVRISLTGPY